jgi:hypothetical protein
VVSRPLDFSLVALAEALGANNAQQKSASLELFRAQLLGRTQHASIICSCLEQKVWSNKKYINRGKTCVTATTGAILGELRAVKQMQL